jgi:uncharacterized membrane protein
MTDEKQTTTSEGGTSSKPATPGYEFVAAEGTADAEGATIVAAAGDETGVKAEAAIVTDYTHALIVAEFADEDAAMETYQALRQAEITHGLHIDAVAVVQADAGGKIHAQKVTDHSTRNGIAWGAAAGIVLGVIFPPSILGSAVAVGAAGGAIGKLRNAHHRIELEEELKGVLPPRSSGIVALVEKTEADAVKETMPKATNVTEKPIDEATAKDIEAEAAKQPA